MRVLPTVLLYNWEWSRPMILWYPDIYSYLLTSAGKNEEGNCNYMGIQSCQ